MNTAIDELEVGDEQKNDAPIELARAFVRGAVQIPALRSSLSPELKSKIKHSDLWLNKFSRVGDLLLYLARFDASHNDPTYREMKRHGLLTFEDITDEFREKFSLWANDCTRITDFVIGNKYRVYDILILSRNYDTRSGGMFVLESNERPAAVVIKATLANGRYPNVWIEEGEVLKYYLKSISGTFGEHFKPNQAILKNNAIPIVTFTRDNNSSPFIYRGIFRYREIIHEGDGGKAFVLKKATLSNAQISIESGYAQRNFERRVRQSNAIPRSERLLRLANAEKRPSIYTVTSVAYSRNPDVVAEVLYQANGVCQGCGSPAPFRRRSDNAPYLEVHHRIPLSMGGDDTVENAIALCPNCHRERHFGIFGDSVSDRLPLQGAEHDLQEAISEKIS